MAAFLRSFNKPKPEFRCNVMGKNVAAASEPELRRRVETALRAQLKKELARIAGLKISL
ncbi:MAG: hypothetical protein MUF81_15320 [Verrucomicrobia bacterium]|nr:hypothetical protein [Verrucomicrobiota bacterium]